MVEQKNENGLEAIILSARSNLSTTFKKEFRALKFSTENIHSLEDVHAVFELMKKSTNTILILDWEIGKIKALELLQAIHRDQQYDNTYIFLIAAELDENIIAAGTEYGVHQVHTGDITSTKIKIVLKDLVEEANNFTPIKKLLIKINELRKSGNWDEATVILKQLYEKDPTNPRIITELGENYIREKNWHGAKEILEKIPTIKPPYIRGLHLLGKCYLKLQDQQKACDIFNQAKLLNPYNLDRLITLGNVLLNMGETDKAKQNFDDALNIDESNKDAKKGKATGLLMEGEINEALGLLRGAVTNHNLASIFNTAAILSIRLGDISKGLKLYDTAMKVLKGSPKILARIHFNKGLGYYKIGDKEKAAKSFKTALSLDPQFENAKHNYETLSSSRPSVSSDTKPREDLPDIHESFEDESIFDFNFEQDLDDLFNIEE